MIDNKEITVPHLSSMLQIKSLCESKIRIVNASVGDQEGHGDDRGELVDVADDDERDGHYGYHYHRVYGHLVGTPLRNSSLTEQP